MKAKLTCDDSGILKINLISEHKFEELLMESFEREGQYFESIEIVRDRDSFGMIKGPYIELKFKLKNK